MSNSPVNPELLLNLSDRTLPQPIERLNELAHNIWWSWYPDARALFRMVSVTLWRRTEHNPVRILRAATQDRLERLAIDPTFLHKYKSVIKEFDALSSRAGTPVVTSYKAIADKKIAYFSAEYGLHSSLPIYSGGLGVLAGDHAKTASDMGLDLTAIGFMYPRGYFEQHIAPDGSQEATYSEIDTANTAIERTYLESGEPAIVSLPLEGLHDMLHLQIWRVRAGRTRLYLMDSDTELNQPWNREISKRLYGGDQEYRLRQEIALGVGGVRIVRLLGLAPDVWHANEGHVAFMLLERLREAVANGMSFSDAILFVRRCTVFTTHTPVPAGHDSFPLALMDKYFSYFWRELGIDRETFLKLGEHQEVWGTGFNMTVLSMNLSEMRNAVSKKHEEVTRQMWPEFVEKDRTITSVTNGVHIPTWIAPEMNGLFTRELGKDWHTHQREPEYWNKVLDIPDEHFWIAKERMKVSLVSFVLERIRRKWMGAGMDAALFIPSGALLDPSILTIGFARRFATYKRATLIFNDLDRLKRILTNSLQPVQFVFSGKAHPADEGGKRLIADIYAYAKDPAFAGRITFIENYSMHVAKNLVRGVDVWMNNPKAPLEASGTSGMKAAINGVPNFSILDGWWIEAANGMNGWALEGATEGSQQEQDRVDANNMYETLEQSIIPLFYDRATDGLPHKWIQVMKESIRTVLPEFSSERMMNDYITNLYMPTSGATKPKTKKQ
ncbi:MAG: alpha-glucan family phosphorylase [Candidatus Kapaibacterium sp.]